MDTITTVARLLHKTPSILFVTGAGISADSGIPTYRGIGGLYNVELTDEGIPIEQVLSGPMFDERPELTWKYLAQIANAARGSEFNRAHEIIGEIEKRFERVWTLTQNVDGFHTLAGAENVIEIHGNMRSLYCTECKARSTADGETEFDIPPRCSECNGIIRPDVVLFEEMLPQLALSQLQRELEVGFGLVISVGTSGLFPYIQAPFMLAQSQGTPCVEINPQETAITPHVDYRIPLGAADAMERIWSEYLAME